MVNKMLATVNSKTKQRKKVWLHEQCQLLLEIQRNPNDIEAEFLFAGKYTPLHRVCSHCPSAAAALLPGCLSARLQPCSQIAKAGNQISQVIQLSPTNVEFLN